MMFTQKEAVVWQVSAACLWGGYRIVFLNYRRNDRLVLITLTCSAIISHCQADQDGANQSNKTHSPKPDAYWLLFILESLHCRETWEAIELMEGVRLKVTLFTSKMTGKCLWEEIWAWSFGSQSAVYLSVCLSDANKLLNC